MKIQYLVVVLVGLIIAYFFVAKSKAQKPPNVIDDDKKKKLKKCNDSFPLTFGSCGPNVKILQKALSKKFLREHPNSKPFSKYGIDGHWGEETEIFRKAMSVSHKISRDSFNKIRKIENV